MCAPAGAARRPPGATETDEGKAALETIATFQREASAATTVEDAYSSLTKAMDVLSARVAPCHPAVLSIVEMLMANAIDAKSGAVAGKQALAMEAFARALRQLPTIIADNAGLDSSDIVTNMRAAHVAGEANTGIDIKSGEIGDMWKLGIRESFKSKLQVLVSAAEAAEMILRVDDIVKAAPRERQ